MFGSKILFLEWVTIMHVGEHCVGWEEGARSIGSNDKNSLWVLEVMEDIDVEVAYVVCKEWPLLSELVKEDEPNDDKNMDNSVVDGQGEEEVKELVGLKKDRESVKKMGDV